MNAQEFRQQRQAMRLSMQAMAFRSGINKAYISEWETGIRVLDPERIARLEAALESPICPACKRPF